MLPEAKALPVTGRLQSEAERTAQLARGSRRRREREVDEERRALPQLALDADGAAVRLDDHARDPKSEAEAAVVARGREPRESFEEAAVVLRLDAGTSIGDDDALEVSRVPRLAEGVGEPVVTALAA